MCPLSLLKGVRTEINATKNLILDCKVAFISDLTPFSKERERERR
jgi:hypothetical protein